MSADFWAGYVSGAAGIILGNPLDILKVRLQAGRRSEVASSHPRPAPSPSQRLSLGSGGLPSAYTAASTTASAGHSYVRPFLLGTAAPVLGYGALNALLFVSYNRTEALLNHYFPSSSAVSSPIPSPSGGADQVAGPGGGASTAPLLLSTWLAGAVGGLATWVVSTPTELVKCRAQLQTDAGNLAGHAGAGTNTGAGAGASAGAGADVGGVGSQRGTAASRGGGGASSLRIAQHVLRAEGLRGLYFGGGVTALRDSIGYGFYFWGYELCTRWWMAMVAAGDSGAGGTSAASIGSISTSGAAAAAGAGSSAGGSAAAGGAGGSSTSSSGSLLGGEAARVLLCGGLAGIISWASIFPLDVIKTRVQTQVITGAGGVGVFGERSPLLGTRAPPGSHGAGGGSDGGVKTQRLGAWEVAKETYREGGLRPFFRGLMVCSVRAFIVNAVQWAVYEWIMMELGQGKQRRQQGVEAGLGAG